MGGNKFGSFPQSGWKSEEEKKIEKNRWKQWPASLRSATKVGARLDQKSISQWLQWSVYTPEPIPEDISWIYLFSKKMCFFAPHSLHGAICKGSWPLLINICYQLQLSAELSKQLMATHYTWSPPTKQILEAELLLVQACLRAPHVVADEAKLAIVFTYFFLLFLSFFFYAFCFSPTSGESPVRENLFPPIFWHN